MTDATEGRYARLGTRVAANVADWAILLLAAALGRALWSVAAGAPPGVPALVIAFGALHAAYHVIGPASPLEGTPGKRLLGIAVYRRDGAPLSPLRALARWLACLPAVLTFGLGFLIAAITPRRLALQDLIAGTVVVERGDGPARGETLAALAVLALALAASVVLWQALTSPALAGAGAWLRTIWIVGITASRHPGARVLERHDCDAMVLSVDQARALLEPFAGGEAAPVVVGTPFVVCKLRAGAAELGCAEVARVFAGVYARPPPRFIVLVRRRGEETARCAGYYAPDGSRIGGVGADGGLVIEGE